MMFRNGVQSVSFRQAKTLNCFSRSLSDQARNYKPADDKEFSKAKPFKAIPGLSAWKLFKRYWPGGQFDKTPMSDNLDSLRREFGDFFKIPGLFGQKTIVMTFDPDDVEFIHRNEGPYPFRRGLETMKHFRNNVRNDVYPFGGIVVEQGPEWSEMRQVVNPILMKPQIVASYIPLIDTIVNEFMTSIPELQDAKGEMPANFNEYLNRWSLESISAISLEKRLGLMNFKEKNEFGERVAKAVRKIFTLGMEFEMKPSIWRYYETKAFKELMDTHNELTNLSLTLIEDAKQRFKSGAFKGNEKNGILFKLLEKDERFATVMAFDMIFGAIDSTTSALGFTLYCLAKNPEKQEKLRAELKTIMPERDTPLTEKNMKNMPYLRSVLKETLRLFPPVFANMRRFDENLVIQGYQIPKGIDVIMSFQHIYKDPKYFGSPNDFIPERWMRDADACPIEMKQWHKFSYLPFGYGVRLCAGKRIAQMEVEVFTSRLLRNYKVEWHHDDMKVNANVVLFPDSDLKFKLIPV